MTKTEKERGTRRLAVDVPHELASQFEELAGRHERSLMGEIRAAMREHLAASTPVSGRGHNAKELSS